MKQNFIYPTFSVALIFPHSPHFPILFDIRSSVIRTACDHHLKRLTPIVPPNFSVICIMFLTILFGFSRFFFIILLNVSKKNNSQCLLEFLAEAFQCIIVIAWRSRFHRDPQTLVMAHMAPKSFCKKLK